MRRLIFVWFIVILLANTGALAAQDSEADTEAEAETPASQRRASRVELRALEADVTPVLDVTLPSGSVTVESSILFSNLELTVRTDYDFLDNSIGAQAAFAYPLGRLLPELIFFDAVDFESTVEPRLTGDGFSLRPSDRYVSRRRGAESRLWYFLLPEWRVGPSFIVSEHFRGTLTEAQTVEDAIYYTASMSTSVDTVTTEDLDTATFSGWELSSSLDWNFRGSVKTPTSLDHVTRLGVYASFRDETAVEPTVTVAYPIEVWEGETAEFYSLGGVNSIRGYQADSINAYRYVLGSLDVRPILFPRLSIPLRIGRRRSSLERFRLLLLGDALAAQSSTLVDSPVSWNGSAGAGVSFVLSGARGARFRTRLYVAWPVEPDPEPIFYWQTSLFSLGGSF